MTNARSLLACAAVFAAAVVAAAPATIEIDAGKVKCPVSQDLWGIFFEDIDLSLDGGVYAELVRNRSFEDGNGNPRAALGFWREEGGAKMKLATEQPISEKNRHSLKVAAPAGGGVSNEGYFGVAARPGIDYRLSIAVRGDAGTLRVALESADGEAVSTEAKVRVGGGWKTETASIQGISFDPHARLAIRSEKGGTFFIDCVSLFPSDTYGTSGIFRRDLMERLAALKPAFVRFPGGCWVEGNTMREAYRWKKTIGSIWERPTQWNIWGYWATHGVGFHEYLLICEELGAKPLFCINVGMSHRENVPMEKMDEFVQDALDCIEYCNGPVDSKWGAVRAAAGHPKPFNLEYLEIGNENGGPEYEKRYKLIANAVRAKYPNVKLVFDNWSSTKDVDAPKDLRDDHFYMTPDWFMMNAWHYSDPRLYDARSGKFGIFVGEYAVTRGTGKFGSLRAAIGEAAFMTGLENSSDVVKLAAYAPLFANVRHQRWSPDMIYVGPASNFVNPSFEVQRLFAENRGKDVLATKVECERVSETGDDLRFGVGSWSGQAAFKDVRVVDASGKVLYENSFATADAVKDWKSFGSGKWEIVDGVLTQTGPAPMAASTAMQLPGKFREATITLKAKSVSGPEGFLVLLGDARPVGGRWVNFGGWGNGQHGVECPGFDGRRTSGSIKQGRWYDVKVEVRGGKLRAWLDGKLALEANRSSMPSIVADATTSPDGREIIVKVVNCSRAPVDAVVSIAGAKLAAKAKMQLFTGPDADACNSMENPDRLHAVDMPVDVADGKVRRVFPVLSFSIIRVPLASRR